MKKLTLFPLLFFAGLALNGVEKIPLSKAIENGLQTSFQLKNQLLEEEAAQIGTTSAAMKMLFNIDFSGSYLYKSQQMEITLPGIGPAPAGVSGPGQTIVAGSKHNVDLKLALTQPLFSGGILSQSLKKERFNVQSEKYLTELKKIDIAGQIKTAYLNFRLLTEKRRSHELLLEEMTLHLKKIELLVREELAKKTDLLETEATCAEARLGLLDLDVAMTAEELRFQRLTGFDAAAIEDDYREPELPAAEAGSRFRSGHPLLKVWEEKLHMLQAQRRIVSGTYLPQLNGFAELHYGRPGIDFFKNEWSFYFQGGVALYLPVFNWNRMRHDLELVDLAARKLENQRDDFIAETERNLQSLLFSRDKIKNKLATLDELIGLAEEELRIKERLYLENQIAHTDFLAAVTGRERYRSQKQESLTQLQLLNAAINAACGQSVEDK